MSKRQRLLPFVLAIVLVIALASMSLNGVAATKEHQADFSVVFLTTSILQGTFGNVNLSVASLDNFASPVSLTFSAPPGVWASFNGLSQIDTFAYGTSSRTVTIYVSEAVAPGFYPFTVTAFSGTITHSVILQLLVLPYNCL